MIKFRIVLAYGISMWIFGSLTGYGIGLLQP